MTPEAGAEVLLTPEAVRERCAELFEIGVDGGLPWFRIDASRLDPTIDFVVEEIRRNYPSLDVPFR